MERYCWTGQSSHRAVAPTEEEEEEEDEDEEEEEEEEGEGGGGGGGGGGGPDPCPLDNFFFRKICSYYDNNQQDALYRLIYYSKSALHVLGDVFGPSSGALVCIYSIW